MNCASLFSKKTVFERPNLPTGEQILQDLNNAADDDIAFQILNKDNVSGEGQTTINYSALYQEMKAYLKTKESLKGLLDTLSEKESSLIDDKERMQSLAKNLRQQAQEALNP